MSDTPQTDLLVLELNAKGSIMDRYSAMREHARNLEREINEWKKAADMANGSDTPAGLSLFVQSVEQS